MAKFTFSAESDDLHEIAALVAAMGGAETPRVEHAKEPEVPVEAKTATKSKKGKSEVAAAATATETTSTTTTEAAAASEEPASGEGEPEVSQQDVLDAANEWLKKYPTGGPKLMDALGEKLGTRQLRQIAPEKRGEALALIGSLVP